MDYLETLQFETEPFSASPDPLFFFPASQHVLSLQQLELAIRLRRGLNVVVGEVGTGKTMLSQTLLSRLASDCGIELHSIQNPEFSHSYAFLRQLAKSFDLTAAPDDLTEWQLKERIKNHLFTRGVEQNRVLLLVIDEGQNISGEGLELLREFMNYETNSCKLLQVVILAQPEFERALDARPNLADRINLFIRLNAFDFGQTRELIRFRLNRASRKTRNAVRFSWAGLLAAYWLTGGCPRRIIHLCHRVMLMLALRNCRTANWRCVLRSSRSGAAFRRKKWLASLFIG